MPNELSASLLGHRRPPRTGMSCTLAGTEYLPTLNGKVLYYPLYSNQEIPFPTEASQLGFIGAALGVSATTVNNATSFLSTFTAGLSAVAGVIGDIISTIASVISGIIGFIVKNVAAVVGAVVSAAGGLLGAVTDLFTVKDDNQGKKAVTPQDALSVASMLMQKHDSLKPATQAGRLDRPMTSEEQTGFQRTMSTAKAKLDQLIASVGGPGGALLIGAGIGALILLWPKKG